MKYHRQSRLETDRQKVWTGTPFLVEERRDQTVSAARLAASTSVVGYVVYTLYTRCIHVVYTLYTHCIHVVLVNTSS